MIEVSVAGILTEELIKEPLVRLIIPVELDD